MEKSPRDKWLEAEDAVLLRDCQLDFHKASGKGGQKVNKTSSAVRVTHLPSGVSATSQESRSQTENRSRALRRLRLAIAFQAREEAGSPPDLERPPSERNPAYASWVAALLDVLHEESWDLKAAALRLNASPSKLAKTLYKDPALWQEASRHRAALGLPPLRPPS